MDLYIFFAHQQNKDNNVLGTFSDLILSASMVRSALSLWRTSRTRSLSRAWNNPRSIGQRWLYLISQFSSLSFISSTVQLSSEDATLLRFWKTVQWPICCDILYFFGFPSVEVLNKYTIMCTINKIDFILNTRLTKKEKNVFVSSQSVQLKLLLTHSHEKT